MTAQLGLCQTCSETTLLVFPRDGSNGLHPPTLHVLSDDGAIMNFGILSPNRVPRTILYFEDMTEAENYLRTVIGSSSNH